MVKKILSAALLLVIITRTGWLIYQNRAKYTADYWNRYPTLKGVFEGSQYMMKNWKYWIPDETVYSYAGGAYAKGADPIIVESTQPPMGKYLIALSILITGNENVIVPVFFIAFLAGIYILSKQVTGSTIIPLIVVAAAVFETLFTDQLAVTPLLDIFQITFLIYAVAAAAYAVEKRKPYVLLIAYACFGASLMIKVWLIGMVFVIPVTVYILLRAKKYYLYVIGGCLIMLGLTLLNYTEMFLAGYNIIQVLLVQKYLYWYQNGKRTGIFTIWPLIFMNKWYVWWGNVSVIQDASWAVSWPVSIGIGIAVSIRTLVTSVKKSNTSLYLVSLCILAYSVFISMGQASARYLLPLLPFCYVMGGWVLYRIAGKISFIKKII